MTNSPDKPIITVCDLKEKQSELTPIINDIKDIWYSRSGGAEIDGIFDEKLTQIQDGKIKGICFDCNQYVFAIAWVEKVTINYGSIFIHTMAPSYAPILTDTLVKSGLVSDLLFELSCMTQFDDYAQMLRQLGFIQTDRQRMIRRFDHPIPTNPALPAGHTLSPIQSADAPSICDLSVRAHQVSHDYDAYDDLVVYEKRLELENRLNQRIYGPVIEDAMFTLKQAEKLMGFISLVEVPCWGYEKVPWVFDVCVEPGYHGKGFGKVLMISAMNRLQEMAYPVMGLAVSLNNTGAIGLYEKLGFENAGYFSEFIKKNKNSDSNLV